MTNDEARERKVIEAEQKSGVMIDELKALRAVMESMIVSIDGMLERVEGNGDES